MNSALPTTRHSSFLYSLPNKATPTFKSSATFSPTASVTTTTDSPCSSMASGRTAHWELAPRIPLFPLNLSGQHVVSSASSCASTLGFLDVFAPTSMTSVSSCATTPPTQKVNYLLPLTPSPTPPPTRLRQPRGPLSCLPEERETPNSTPITKRALQLGSPFRSSASCNDFAAHSLAVLGRKHDNATVQSSSSMIQAAAAAAMPPVLLISPAPSSVDPSPRYLPSIFSASSAGDSPAWGASLGVRSTPPPRPPRRRPVATATLISLDDAQLADTSDVDASSSLLDTPPQLPPRQPVRAVANLQRQKRTAEQLRKLSNAPQPVRRANVVKERSTIGTTVRPSSAGTSHVARPRSRHASTHSRIHAGCALGLPMAFRLVRKKRKMRVQDLPSMQPALRSEPAEVVVIRGQPEVVVITRQVTQPESPSTMRIPRKPVVLHGSESTAPLLASSPIQPPPPAPRLGSKKWTADSSPSDAGSPTWLPLPPVTDAKIRKAKSPLVIPMRSASQRSSSDSNGSSSGGARQTQPSIGNSSYNDLRLVAGGLLEAATSSQASLRSSLPSPTSSTARSSLAPPGMSQPHPQQVKPKRSSRLMRALSSLSLRPAAGVEQRNEMDIGAPTLVSTSASLDELECRTVFDMHGHKRGQPSAEISRATSPVPARHVASTAPASRTVTLALPMRASSRPSQSQSEPGVVVAPSTPPPLRSRVVTPSNAAAEQGEALVLAASDSSTLLATYEGASLLLAFYAAQLGLEEDAPIAATTMRISSSDRPPSFDSGSGGADASPYSSSASSSSLDSDLYDGRRLVRAFWNEGEDSSTSRRGSRDAPSFPSPPAFVLDKAKSCQVLKGSRVDPLQINTLPFPAL